MTGFSYTDCDGAVLELTQCPDGSVTVTAQGVDGPIVCIAIPAGERAGLAAAASPLLDDDMCEWERFDPVAARAAAWAAGGPGDD